MFVSIVLCCPVPRVNQATAGCCHSQGSARGKKQMIWMAEDPKARVAHSENNQIHKPWVSMQNLGYKVTPYEFCSSCFPGYIYIYIYCIHIYIYIYCIHIYIYIYIVFICV